MTRAAVSLYALEHEPVIDRGVLDGLADWSAEEKSRMDHFIDKSALCSYCLARVLARRAIRAAAFSYGANGKPYLDGPGPRFNWSHSRGCVLLAISPEREVGADIEAIERGGADFQDLADRFFSREESEWVRSGDGGCGRERFLSLFVQKEASLKMTGVGLSGSLSEAPAERLLPPFADGRSILFRVGGGYIGAARADGEVAGFELFASRFDPERGLRPMEEWERLV